MHCQNMARAERTLTIVDFQTVGVQDKELFTERIAELLSVSKNLISRCIYDDTNYDLVHSNLLSLQKFVHATTHEQQRDTEKHAVVSVLNPLKVKTKGRPKQKRTREKSIAEQQRQKKAKKHSARVRNDKQQTGIVRSL